MSTEYNEGYDAGRAVGIEKGYQQCRDDIAERLAEAEEQNHAYAQALRLIAAPARPDGTFNRCREACQQIAEKALNGK